MAAWQITAKDLYLLLRDRRTFAVLLLLPLAFITIIGLTTGELLGWRSSNARLKIAVVDAIDYDAIGTSAFLTPVDGSEEGGETEGVETLSAEERALERRFAGHVVANILNGMQRSPGIEVRTVSGWEERLEQSSIEEDPIERARQLIADDKVNAVLVFTPDFYRRVYHLDIADMAARDEDDPLPRAKLEQSGLDLITARPDSSTASAVAAILAYQFRDVLEPILFCRSDRVQQLTLTERRSSKYQSLCGPVNSMKALPPPDLLPPQSDPESEGNGSMYEEIVPSYTVMFVFFLVTIMARSFLAERDLGTLRRLQIAPISGWSILTGKTLPFLAISLIQTGLLFLMGRLLFGMTWGNHPWMLLPVIFATSAAATGLGLLIATLVTTDAQVSAYANTAVIILAGISGCFMPRQWLPEIMQQVSLATPHAWALIAYDQLLSRPVADLAAVWQCVGMLLVFAVGFFVVGGLRFRRGD